MPDIYQEIVKLRKEGTEGVLLTVVGKDGHGPAGLGTKMLVLADGNRVGTVGGGALEYSAIKKAGQVMKDKKNRLKKYLLSHDNDIIDGDNTGMLCGGNITIFYEYVGSGSRIYIFGAGHIGQSLLYHLKGMNYYITLIDSREGIMEDVGDVQRTITGPYETVLRDEKVPENSFFIIASHSHSFDYLILKRIYESSWAPQYVGMIASKKKAPELKNRLLNDLGLGTNIDNLYTPMGLDIGGQSPDEIAISIIAEIQSVRFRKEGHKHIRSKVEDLTPDSEPDDLD